jgi:pimeloyl-ACP methyl ester carboxylesterase
MRRILVFCALVSVTGLGAWALPAGQASSAMEQAAAEPAASSPVLPVAPEVSSDSAATPAPPTIPATAVSEAPTQAADPDASADHLTAERSAAEAPAAIVTTTTAPPTTTTAAPTVTVAFTATQAFGSCDEPIPYDIFSGAATAGSTVSISSPYGSGSTTADANGHWEHKVEFPPALRGEQFLSLPPDRAAARLCRSSLWATRRTPEVRNRPSDGIRVSVMTAQQYDEFGLFQENAAEYDLLYDGPPTVRRETIALERGTKLSALVWGDADPELVLIHGGAQNAHTWDTVALKLDRPLIAIDLPGHGHSDFRPEHDYIPTSMADDVAQAVQQLAPNAKAVVGMSLGGMTAICLAADHPDLVRRLGVVDVTPGTDHAKAEPIIAFVDGPEYFKDFAEILSRTVEFNPGRSEVSLRRGILHNAYEMDDGQWTWRYDRMRDWKIGGDDAPSFEDLWDKVDDVKVPITLWQGGKWSVIGDEDVTEWMKRRPDTIHIVVEGAGHSIQGDKPMEMAAHIEDLLAR